MATDDDSKVQAYETAQRLASSGNFDEAIVAYSAAIESGLSSPKAYVGRGLALQRLGNHTMAIVDFDDVIDSDPDWPGISIAYYGRAVSLHALGRSEEAINDCNEVISRDAKQEKESM